MFRRWLLALVLVCPIVLSAKVPQVVFSHQGGFYEKPFHLTLSCPKGYSIHYTVNGNIPTFLDREYKDSLLLDETLYSHSDLYTIQCCSDEEWYVPDRVHHGIVLRAAVFDENGKRCGEVTTNSFFIKSLGNDFHNLPVVSLCADSLSLFGFDTGIFVRGATGANYAQNGMAWERLCNFEFYEFGSQGLNQQVGIRLHGSATRDGIQKGMKLYARREYSGTRLNYSFFGSKGRNSFKHLVLKPFSRGLFRDQVCTEMAGPLDFETPFSRPVVVFLNGEYWGLYYLKERPDAQYIADHYGCNKEEVNVIESWDGKAAYGSNGNYVEMMKWLGHADCSNDSVYQRVCRYIDIDSFIDYYCFQLFIANSDWPANNMRCWQVHDGKWRWIFFDGDYGLDSFQPMLYSTIINEENSDVSTLLFTRLLANADFRNRFYHRFGTLLTHELDSRETLGIYHSCYEDIEDEVDAHFRRFGLVDYEGRFDFETRYVDMFLSIRMVSAAAMIYTLFYYNNWEYPGSKSSENVRFYPIEGERPTFLFSMARQFEDWGFVSAYFSYERFRIRKEIKESSFYQYLKHVKNDVFH